MRAPKTQPRQPASRNMLWELLTFERLMTGPVLHLIYWSGLALLALSGFTVIGAAVGMAIRGGSWEGMLLAIPALVGGFLVLTALALLWRGACEFFLAIFQIAEDLRALRGAAEAESAPVRTASPRTMPPTNNPYTR